MGFNVIEQPPSSFLPHAKLRRKAGGEDGWLGQLIIAVSSHLRHDSIEKLGLLTSGCGDALFQRAAQLHELVDFGNNADLL